MKIFKYYIDHLTENQFSLDLPKGSAVLSFQNQLEKFVVWALVDETAELQERKFILLSTGEKIDEKVKFKNFVCTAQFQNESLVFHLFEIF